MTRIIKKALPVCLLAAGAFAADNIPTHVPSANPKALGIVAPNVLSPELFQTPVATGSFKLENPSGIFTHYGYNSFPVGAAMIPTAPGSKTEWNKTEPDKNTYLILKKQRGADPSYDYGRHFLFQGHETGVSGYLTRINLDADSAHKVTLMATTETSGAALPVFDGSTWYPFSQRLLLTSEGSLGGGVWQFSLDVPSKVANLTGIMGQGGFEGIQSDSQGRLMIVEDSGGSAGAVNNFAKRPNSFVFRFLPYDKSDLLKGGILQALQVKSLDGTPMSFNKGGSADADVLSQDVKDLHTYGKSFQTTWIQLHDTKTDGTAPFNANALAKTLKATPFKRPENGQFRPGSGFSEFIFDETGDTDARSQANGPYGGYGSILRLRLTDDVHGVLSLVYLGDQVHTAFDNCSFWDEHRIVFVEDAGDTLHTQRNGLDSAWLFDLNTNYSSGAQPIRVLAQGRDASATLDSMILTVGGFTGTFNNEGDNEVTGWHQSDGDPTASGLLGAKIPKPFRNGWRLFYTQQHGDNNTFEILSNDDVDDDDSHDHGHGRDNDDD